MKDKYKIVSKFIKDLSSETPDIETYIFVKNYISKYQLNIDINTKALKNRMVEVNTIMKFEDKEDRKKKIDASCTGGYLSEHGKHKADNRNATKMHF